jgi:tetratricopeptide (TPR) repeat protein
LVETRAISYSGGGWTLPESFATRALPEHVQDVFRARIAALDARALRLARAQSLSVFDGFARTDYALLEPEVGAAEIDAAVAELLDHDVLRCDGATYALSHRAVRDALRAGMTPAERAQYHRALAELYERTGRPAIGAAAHFIDAGEPERALDRLGESLRQSTDIVDLSQRTRMPDAEIAVLLERALDAAERLPRNARELFELRRWVLAQAVPGEDRLHGRVAAQFLAQLERDSGLMDYREQDSADPAQRLTRALQRAAERYAATPESERVYRVDEAIKLLVSYVVVSIVIGSRTFDLHLIASLAPLLEPFAPLSPLLHAMWQNALATLEMLHRRFESARARWLAVYESLEGITNAQLEHVDAIRNAIAYALGMVEALLGMHTAGRWAALLDKDPQQHVSAMYLRKTLCLQQGDFETAERFRRKAEVLAVQATTRQMFATNTIAELFVHATARDLTGVKQIMDRIQPLAARYKGWRPYQYIAEGHFHRLRGDLGAALAAFERALAVFPDESDAVQRIVAWPSAVAGYVETLLEQGEYERARAASTATLERCKELGIAIGASDVERGLALAEGKLGDLDGAARRMQSIIDAQLALGVTGLHLGASFEARARIAIWAGDSEAVEHYGRLAANEYRHGSNSTLGSRYERLMQEAQRAGIYALPQLASLDAGPVGTSTLGGPRATETVVTEVLNTADGRAARSTMALGLLCDAYGAGGGHLYLMGEDSLDLAATVAAEAPDALDALVTSFWNQRLEEPDMPTAFVADAEAPASTGMWTDSRGTAYQPVPISCVVGGVSLHVGVALLIPGGEKPRNVRAAEVTATIGKYLIQCGDTRGLPA